MVGGVVMATARAADSYQLDRTLDRWRGAGTSTSAPAQPQQMASGQNPPPSGLVDENLAYARRARSLGLG